jgi:hypothetical protein
VVFFTVAATFAFSMVSFTVAASFAFSVMSFAVAAAFTLSVVSVSASVAAASFTVMAVMLLGEIFSVETFGELFLGGFPYAENAAREVELLSGHRGIEVHYDGIFEDFSDGASFHIAVTVEHGDDITHYKEVFPYLAVNLEGVLRKGDLLRGIIFSVSLFGRNAEREGVSYGHAFDFGLELGNEHVGSVDVVEGIVGGGAVDHLTVHLQFIEDFYDFVLFYFHF